MALSDIIATIISRSKVIEICDSLHDVQNSTTEEEVIEAGLPLLVYSYQAGIIDDSLIADFTESTLNSYNIFTTGTFTITNPDSEVYILKNAIVSLTISGTWNGKINVMGAATLNLTIGDTCFATVKVYDNGIANVTINDDAMVTLACKENSNVTAIVNTNGIFHLTAYNFSVCGVTTNNNSYAKATLFHNSSITPANYDTSTLLINLYQNAQSILS